MLDRKLINVTLEMSSYIAHPYWPEKEKIIRISSQSGEKRMRNEEKIKTAIATELKKAGLSEAQYADLLVKSERKWYRKVNDDEKSPIIIPRHHLAGMLVNAVATAPKNLRGEYHKDSFRHFVQISDFATTKVEKDGVYSRYIRNAETNVRRLTENEYIENFIAIGEVSLLPDQDEQVFRNLFAHAIEVIGVGSARKMGYGRGQIKSWVI